MCYISCQYNVFNSRFTSLFTKAQSTLDVCYAVKKLIVLTTDNNKVGYALIITARKRSLGQGNIFTSVGHSVGGGGSGGFQACITGHMTRGVLPRGVCIGGVCIQEGVCLQGGSAGGWADPLPRYMGYYGIRSTSGQYASYWNAFLLRSVYT